MSKNLAIGFFALFAATALMAIVSEVPDGNASTAVWAGLALIWCWLWLQSELDKNKED